MRPGQWSIVGLLLVAGWTSAGAQSDPSGAEAAADPATGTDLVVLFHHPYPDAADPFGFAYPAGSDSGYYQSRYRHVSAETNNFEFPHAVIDGTIPVEGIPDPEAPYASTLGAYRAAYDERAGQPAPAILEVVASRGPSQVLAALRVLPRDSVADEGLHAWAALVEDHIEFNAGALGNGITDHRFTVRAITDLGAIGATEALTATFAMPDGATEDQLYVAAWLQQDGRPNGRYDPHEVVQATIHPLRQSQPTIQEEKAVLLELYSATWCDPCLFGDRAAEELAAEFGVQSIDPAPRDPYSRPVPAWALIAAIGAGVTFAFVRFGRSEP